MNAYYEKGKIRLEIGEVQHGIDGATCDRLVNELLTARHLQMEADREAMNISKTGDRLKDEN